MKNKKIEIKVLGSGGAFSDRYGNTQFYIDCGTPEESLLFDCGITYGENSRVTNFDKSSVKNIFISHLHDDHVGGLATLALMHYFYPNFEKPNLYIHESLKPQLWSSLAPALETLADHQLPKNKLSCQLDDYFNVHVLESNSVFFLGESKRYRVRPVRTIHVVHGAEFMKSYGIELCDLERDKTLLITGDTQFAPDQLRAREGIVDMIIHDCEIGYKSGVHAHVDDLLTLDECVRKKIYLCHYPDNIDDVKKPFEDKFKGIVKRGDIIRL